MDPILSFKFFLEIEPTRRLKNKTFLLLQLTSYWKMLGCLSLQTTLS